MRPRSGIYIVPTHRWYIERTVWLIAGGVLLVATALALLVHPLSVLAVMATGATSIVVALTGFCPVGNALARFGLTPMLAGPGWAPGDLYFMRTDRWYLERCIYLAVGINLSVASVLTLVHSPWWLLFTGFVGFAMVWFAATGFCIMANGLYWLGAEPRLAPRSEPGGDVAPSSSRQAHTEHCASHRISHHGAGNDDSGDSILIRRARLAGIHRTGVPVTDPAYHYRRNHHWSDAQPVINLVDDRPERKTTT